MDLPRLLFGAGLQIFTVTPQIFRFSREHIERLITATVSDAYKRC